MHPLPSRGASIGSWQVTTECVWLLQYFLQRGWSSCSSRGKSSQVSAPAPGLTRVNHRTSASSRTATSNPSDQEVEVCVATLPYVRGRGIPPPNLPKSATTWGPLHKPLIWKVSLWINAISSLLPRSWPLSSLACVLASCMYLLHACHGFGVVWSRTVQHLYWFWISEAFLPFYQDD